MAQHARQRGIGEHETFVLRHEHAVGHGRQQRAHGGLAVAQRGFGRLALGDVARDAEHAGHAAVVVVQRALGGQEDTRAVGGGQRLLVGADSVLGTTCASLAISARPVGREQRAVVVAQICSAGGPSGALASRLHTR
jgi:hypothetical protein